MILGQVIKSRNHMVGMPMKILSTYISLLLLLIISVHPNHIHAGEKLLQESDFEYLGAFRVPKTDMGGPLYQGLSFGGHAIAYNQINNSLFIVGHGHSQLTAEINIPEIIKSDNIENLKTSTVIQNLADITNGHRDKITADGNKDIGNGASMGGMMTWKYKRKDGTEENWLIGSVCAYYDGDYEAVKSHFATSLKLSSSSPQFSGMLELGTKPSPVPQAGFIGGYMTPIPGKWQDSLGGKALSGMSGLPIISRTSLGPAAFSFYPDELVEKKSPAKATALLYYPLEHPTIGDYGSPGTLETSGRLYNMGTFQTGVIFPTGTQSIIFTGQYGLGEACYGQGTNKIEEASMPNYCYDPSDQSKGVHTYPYAIYAWAYDAEDLARVKAGGRIVDNPSENLVDGITKTSTENYKPWHIRPYAHWAIKLPFADNTSGFKGASAYDEESKRMYLVQLFADGDRPIIHVFQIKTDSIPDLTPKIKLINLVH